MRGVSFEHSTDIKRSTHPFQYPAYYNERQLSSTEQLEPVYLLALPPGPPQRPIHLERIDGRDDRLDQLMSGLNKLVSSFANNFSTHHNQTIEFRQQQRFNHP